MKLKLKISFALLLGIAFIYSACKKSGSNPNPTLTPKQVTSQVALNITQSLFGGLGAFDVSGGLSAPTTFALHTKGKVLNAVGNPDCGLIIDTTLAFTDTVSGTIASVSGNIKFGITCTNNIISGYTNTDNVTIAFSNAQISFSYKVIENLTLLSQNPLDDNADLSLHGSLNSTGSYQLKTGTKGSGSEVFNYTLTSLVIDPNAGDVVSGSASFNTQGSGPQGVWNFSGTITFFGNHQAKVLINGTTYNVDLQTGLVS